ncbi:MAG: histidine kinase N-terminal domain-containing protein [Caldilineales bacterium]|nr:histidine kinase N-terminal domain-containing protein [Caldilineales bacterium]
MAQEVDADYLHIDEQIWQAGISARSESDQALMLRVRDALSLAADISRSDLFLMVPGAEDQVCVAVHAQPHSIASLYLEPLVGRCYRSSERSWLWASMTYGLRRQRIEPESPLERPEVSQQVLPILNDERESLGAVVVYTNVIERERHRRRDPAFQRALVRFLQQVSEGNVLIPTPIPPFSEQDGIVFVDHTARYRYLSGQASNVYRRMGYLDDLRERTLDEVAAGDLRLLDQAWATNSCVSREDTVRGRILQRTVVPLLGAPDLRLRERLLPRRRQPERMGALILVTDLTEVRDKAQELRVKAMMLKEMHHRVKNNLQMLVSIMRMQARRAQTDEARQLLQESINRILSMSVIHESLSQGDDQVLNLQAVVRRIVGQIQQGAIGPGNEVQLLVDHADDVFLPTNKATAAVLVLNELLLNAVEHGFDQGTTGKVWISLFNRGDLVELQVLDNGLGLPENFSLESESSLGLDIMRTLVHDDLKGEIDISSRPGGGAQAVVCFPLRSGPRVN